MRYRGKFKRKNPMIVLFWLVIGAGVAIAFYQLIVGEEK
jgi:hypothetical protein